MKPGSNRIHKELNCQRSQHDPSILRNNRIPRLSRHVTLYFLLKLFFAVVLFCTACRNEEETNKLPDIAFDKTKWNEKKDDKYVYREQMVNDLLKNYQWTGMKKDSVIQMLGQPDAMEDGNMIYDYDRKPMLGGLMTSMEAMVFVLAPDSTVRLAKLNDAGWD